MMKNVLLVEPRKHKVAMLSLMKFSTYFENKGYNIVYTQGVNFFNLPKSVDKLVVSGVFTFDLPKLVECTNYYKSLYQLDDKNVYVGGVNVSLMKDYVREMCGDVNIHVGICDKIDDLKPDYSLYPDIDYSIAYSTRGCIRKCGFCAVHRIEPVFKEIETWEKNINMRKDKILMFDNNFTACRDEWFERVCNRLSYFDKVVDFNQSTDCRLFTEFHMKNFAKLKMECIRFSYDGAHVNKQKLIETVELVHSYGYNDIRFDVLYNWTDTPEDFYERISLLNKLDCKAFPMRFVPLTSLDREYVGKHWSKEMLAGFNKVFGQGFSNGMIGNGKNSRKTFLKTFGQNSEEFVKKISSFYIDDRLDKIDTGQNLLTDWI